MVTKPLGTVRLVKNGRITIPIDFRIRYRWAEGTLFMLYDDNGKIIIEKI